MKFFVNTAYTKEIKRTNKRVLLNGATTNLILVALFESLIREIE